MSLIDAFMVVSWFVAFMLFAAVSLSTMAFAVFLPIIAMVGALEDGPDWRELARLGAWWIASLVALVLLVWTEGNVEPWLPR